MALGTREGLLKAVELLESILRCDPDAAGQPDILLPLARCRIGLGDLSNAAPVLVRTVKVAADAATAAEALVLLGEVYLAQGQLPAWQHYLEQALSLPGLDPPTRSRIERRLKGSR
jgi:hypothetical protein